MKRKEIRRRVTLLDTSNQLTLLDDTMREAVPAAEKVKPAIRMQFNAPRAEKIFINQTRLDEHLKRVGQREPLQVRALLDALSFEQFESAYCPGGRPPYAPRAMLGLILYGMMKGVNSLRELEVMAKTDLGCWWVTGAIMPDHSIVGRFIQRHDALLTSDFFAQLTRQVLKVTGTKTSVVAGDGTVMEAAASRYRILRQEALAQALEEARAIAQKTAAAASEEKVAQLEQAQAMLQERQEKRVAHGRAPETVTIHPTEPDAVVQPQKDKNQYRPSYKPQVLANEHRIIVACDVHPSSETASLEGLLDQAGAHGKVDTLLADAGYFSQEVIELTQTRGIELLCPEGRSEGQDWNKQSDKHYPKSHFTYDAQHDCYRCPAEQLLRPKARYKGSAERPSYVEYGTAACIGCAQKAHCTQSEKGRRIKRYESDAAKEALRARMTEPEIRARYRQRQAMVEPVFSQIRGKHGMRRFRRSGLTAVRLEWALHAMAYNLSRAMALWSLICAIYWLVLASVRRPTLQNRFNRRVAAY